GRESRTCRGWPYRYPDAWEQLVRLAENHLLGAAAGEALTLLRKLTRCNNLPLAQNSAKFLYAQRRASLPSPAPERAPAAPGDWGPFLAYLETLDDAAVQAFLAEFLARRQAQAGPALLAGGGPAGPDLPG